MVVRWQRYLAPLAGFQIVASGAQVALPTHHHLICGCTSSDCSSSSAAISTAPRVSACSAAVCSTSATRPSASLLVCANNRCRARSLCARDFREFGVQLLTAFMRSRCRRRRSRTAGARIRSGRRSQDELRRRFRLRQVGVIYQADRRLRQRAEFEQCVACTPWVCATDGSGARASRPGSAVPGLAPHSPLVRARGRSRARINGLRPLACSILTSSGRGSAIPSCVSMIRYRAPRLSGPRRTVLTSSIPGERSTPLLRSPSRAVASTAIGCASSRRNANSSARADGRSSHWRSSMASTALARRPRAAIAAKRSRFNRARINRGACGLRTQQRRRRRATLGIRQRSEGRGLERRQKVAECRERQPGFGLRRATGQHAIPVRRRRA